MISKEAAKRLFVMLLALVMTLSMTGYTFVEAFAEDSEDPAATEESLNKETAEETGSAETDAPEGTTVEIEVETETPGDVTQGEKESAETVENVEEQPQKPEESAKDGEELEVVPEEVPEEKFQSPAMEAVALEEIKVRASRDETFLSVFWTKVEGAAYYKVLLNDATAEAKRLDGTENKCIIPLSSANLTVVKVRVEAYRQKKAAENNTPDNNGEGSANDVQPVPEFEKFAEGTTNNVNVINRGKLSNRTTMATSLGLSLRTILGEGNDGCSVAQGAATDGTYAYYMMTSSSNQMGRVVKIRLSDNAVVGYSPYALGIRHANGMTYDSKRNQLVCVGYGAYRHQLTFIDPNSLTITSQQEVKYTHADMDGYKYTPNGIAAIAYVAKYNVYVTRERGDQVSGGVNDIMIFNADTLELIGYVRTKITSAFNGTYQSMDADEKYVYFLVSPGGNVGSNIVLCLDWNSENLLPVLNGEQSYIKALWYANNDGSGTQDAVMTIPISHESEGLFHTTNSDGSGNFYVSEYYGRWQYKTVTKKVKVKVKWKKVRKWYNKKTKKWTTKKPKKKYRGKSKKVWKYKTKTKKKTVTEKDYWARDDYVYYLGTF